MIDIKIDTSSYYGVISDVITYIITVTNKSNVILEDVIIKSVLDEQLKFIIDSVIVDNLQIKDTNIISGINIGNIKESQSKQVVFNVQIIKKIYDYTSVKFIGEYKYKVDDINGKCWEVLEKEADKIRIFNPKLDIIFESNLKEIQLNDEITYFIDIHNSGELDLINLFLINEIPNNMEIIEESFYIEKRCVNSVNANGGIVLGNLKKNEHKKISYKTKVISGGAGGKIINTLKVNYGFILNDNIKIYKESVKYYNSIMMAIYNFKSIIINDEFFIENKNLKCLNEIIPEIEIEKYKIIKTQRGLSLEGQKVNSYKLIVHGIIKEILQYEVLSNLPKISTLYYETQFSTYIVMPDDFIIGKNIEVDAEIEDINFQMTSEKSFSRNINILFIAKVPK